MKSKTNEEVRQLLEINASAHAAVRSAIISHPTANSWEVADWDKDYPFTRDTDIVVRDSNGDLVFQGPIYVFSETTNE